MILPRRYLVHTLLISLLLCTRCWFSLWLTAGFGLDGTTPWHHNSINEWNTQSNGLLWEILTRVLDWIVLIRLGGEVSSVVGGQIRCNSTSRLIIISCASSLLILESFQLKRRMTLKMAEYEMQFLLFEMNERPPLLLQRWRCNVGLSAGKSGSICYLIRCRKFHY